MNKEKIKKEYEILLESVKTNEFYTKIDLTNRVNCYSCKCGHITKTKDVDAGVTPFIKLCESCGDLAKSNFYRDIAPEKEPTIEWYRPTLDDLLKMDNGSIDHVLQGGLLPRKIKSKNE